MAVSSGNSNKTLQIGGYASTQTSTSQQNTADGISLSFDPTLASLKYDGPNQGTVTFQRQSPEDSATFAVSSVLYDLKQNAPVNPTKVRFENQDVALTGNIDSLSIDRAPYTCGDERDPEIAEYQTYGVQLAPTCDDFTEGPLGLAYDFGSYIQGDYKWALVRYPLTVSATAGYGLNLLVQDILLGAGPGTGLIHPLTSGYRNPYHNAHPPSGGKGAKNSRHMFGDVVDMINFSRTQAEHDRIAFYAHQAGAWVEPTAPKNKFPCGLVCIHVDWGHNNPYPDPAQDGFIITRKPGLYAP